MSEDYRSRERNITGNPEFDRLANNMIRESELLSLMEDVIRLTPPKERGKLQDYLAARRSQYKKRLEVLAQTPGYVVALQTALARNQNKS